MLKVCVGQSEDVDAIDAINEVIESCNEELEGLIPQAGILFCAIDFDFQVILDEINRAYPDIELIGCTTDGEIGTSLGFVEDSITLMLFYSDTVEFKVGVGRGLSKDIPNAVKEAYDEARKKCTKEPRVCITTPESLTANAVVVLEQLKSLLGEALPIIGGLAGDQWQMKETFQFYKNEVLNDSIPLLFIAGDINFSFGVDNGWRPIGKKRNVTKVQNNTVFELDNEPILDFYNHYLGEYTKISSEYALAVFPNSSESYYLRSPAMGDEVNRSVTFFGDIPLNAVVQLTESTSKDIVKATRRAVENAIEKYDTDVKPDFALIFSCATRKALLGINTEKEISICKEYLSEKTPIAGFYTYGEIAPLSKNTESMFHNSTFCILLVGEKHG